jgi:hypothetical protein
MEIRLNNHHSAILLKIGENVIVEPQFITEGFADHFYSHFNSSYLVDIPTILTLLLLRC